MVKFFCFIALGHSLEVIAKYIALYEIALCFKYEASVTVVTAKYYCASSGTSVPSANTLSGAVLYQSDA